MIGEKVTDDVEEQVESSGGLFLFLEDPKSLDVMRGGWLLPLDCTVVPGLSS